MKKILVSAGMLRERVRYDGKILPNYLPMLNGWQAKGLVIPVRPEVAGGLSIPRTPVEIQGGDGKDVVGGSAKEIDINRHDVTNVFITGAQEALQLVQEQGITFVILKARSPSCGSQMT